MKWISFAETLFSSLCSFSVVFYTTFQIEDESVYCTRDEHFRCGGRTRCALVTNALSAGDESVENELSNFSHTYTALATSDFQTELISRWLPLTGTHIRKRAVADHALLLWRLATGTKPINFNPVWCFDKYGLVNCPPDKESHCPVNRKRIA